jgi:hypothetical protein
LGINPKPNKMKAKELIDILKSLSPDKEVMIQQGGEHDYMAVNGIKEIQVFDEDGEGGGDDEDDETGTLNIIAIQFI